MAQEHPEEVSTPTPAKMALHSLAPQFNPDYHDVYLAAIEDAIDNHPRMRNIALTGAYGTGKSSILAEVARRYGGRVVEISLSSVGDATEDGDDAEPTTPTHDRTNLIQKEIVKQLLYKESPAKTRGSRFPRVARFKFWPATRLAGLVAFAISVSIWLSGAGKSLEAIAGTDRLAGVLGYSLLWGAITLAVVGLMALTHGRVNLEKLTAGPAAVSLLPQSSSYFDKYLDEIVYYFEISGRDVVVLEDLDRFENVRIFEALRALNTLLNGSAQIRNRRRARAKRKAASDIRFIYALRDSVFEKLGASSDPAALDEAQRELERANRTKFFDLVVPVVPFITHRNARDLMTESMRGTGVSTELIDLAAGHIADMRLIWNLRNEYDIFSRRLLGHANSMPGLDPDRLFAMLLYKSVHMSDFERIRLRRSQLDKLHSQWRSLVNDSLAARTAELGRLQEEQNAAIAAARQSARLGARFAEVIASLNASSSDGRGQVQIVLDSVQTDAQLREPAFWSRVVRDGAPVSLTVGIGRSGATFQISAARLSQLLGQEFDGDGWENVDRPEVESDIAACNRAIDFLRHHTWQEACTSQHLVGVDVDGKPTSFGGFVQTVLTSDLARQLVRRGFINDYFTLYISQYYGEHLRRDALNFIVHAIDANEPDYLYALEPEDVAAILTERGDGILHDRCALNVSILDYLLEESSPLVDRVVRQLVDEQPTRHDFLNVYLAHGTHRRALLERLSPITPEIFTYLVSEAPVDESTRLDLLDAALINWSDDVEYGLNDSVHDYVTEHVLELPVLMADVPEAEADAARAVRMLSKAKVKLGDLAALNPAARSEAVRRSTYRITEPNILVAAGSSDIALDTLLRANDDVYEYMCWQPDEYLAMLASSATTRYAVIAPPDFEQVLWDLSVKGRANLEKICEAASPDCAVADLRKSKQNAWKALVSTQRTSPSFTNVVAYVAYAGGIDDPLARLLEARGATTDVDEATNEDRRKLALQILAAREVLPDPSLRVRLVGSLALAESIPADLLDPEPGELIGDLVEANVLHDDAQAFTARLMVDWPTREFAIVKSANFREFMAPEHIPVDQLAALFDSEQIPEIVKRNVLDDIAIYGVGASRDALEAAARFAVMTASQLDRGQLQLLCAGDIDNGLMVQLLANAPDLLLPELRATLREMGADYATIADVGHARPRLPDDLPHRTLLDRLQYGGIVSQYRSEIGGGLRVALRHQEN